MICFFSGCSILPEEAGLDFKSKIQCTPGIRIMNSIRCQRQCKNDPPRQLKIDPPWKN